MQEYGFSFSELGERRLNDGSRTSQAGLSVSNDPMALHSVGIEPLIQQAEVLAAVIYLNVVQACKLSRVEGHQVLGPAVPHLCQIFGEVESGVGIVPNSQKKDLPAHVANPTNWTIQAVRGIHGMSRGYLRGSRTDRSKRVRAVTPEHAGQPPERVGDHTHAETRCRMLIEGVIVVIAHARHDQRTLGPQCRPQCLDETLRSTFDRRQFRKGGVHHKDTSGLNTQREKLRSDLARFKRVHHLECTRPSWRSTRCVALRSSVPIRSIPPSSSSRNTAALADAL